MFTKILVFTTPRWSCLVYFAINLSTLDIGNDDLVLRFLLYSFPNSLRSEVPRNRHRQGHYNTDDELSSIYAKTLRHLHCHRIG